MTEPAMRQRVSAFYEALASRDADRIGAFLHPDVEFMVYGPVDVLPFFGHRRGRDAVIAMYRAIPTYLHYRSYEMQGLLVDGCNAAAFVRATAELLSTRRVMSWHMAHFITFSGDLVTGTRMLYDSFDIAEQAVGHPINLSIV